MHHETGDAVTFQSFFHTKIVFASILGLGAVWAAPATAQTPTTLEDIVVTATRTPTERNKLGSSITVITAGDLERMQLPSVADVLRRTPGLSVQQNGPTGSSAEIKFRGLEEEHTLVLINGVKQNDPGTTRAAFNFEHLLTTNIERIEIIRGPQATLYGSRANGAVINIITKKGAGDVSGQVKAEAGSRRTGLLAANVGGGGATGSGMGFDYALSGTAFSTEGFSAANENRIPPGFDRPTENDGSQSFSVGFNGGLRPTPETELRATLDHSALYSEFDRVTSRRAVDDDRTKDKEVTSYSMQGRYDALGGALENLLTLSGTDTHIRRTDDLAFSFGADSWYRAVDYKASYYVDDDNVVTAGAGLDQERYASLSGGSTDQPNESLDRRKVHSNLFVQTQNGFFDRLFVTAGLSFDSFDGVHDNRFNGEWTYRAGLSYDLKETGTVLRTSYATGFAAPTLAQLHEYPNKTILSPESTELWDAGFEQSLWNNRVTFGATYFRNKIDDQLVFISTTDGWTNRDRMKSQGFEDSVSVLAFDEGGKRLELSANHTYTLTADQDGTEIDRVPRHRVNFAVDYGFLDGKASLRLDGEWESDHKDFYGSSSNSGITYLGQHWRFDLAAAYQATERIKLHGRIENILDVDYESAAGFASAPFGIFAGMTVSF